MIHPSVFIDHRVAARATLTAGLPSAAEWHLLGDRQRFQSSTEVLRQPAIG
ncbi:hypothetical protein Thiowin_00445 [Thiorhodovibrio winogradskyi]|uniref:Uncharacterized protein n=1 Tax=Thiorhodovibrio winogradskyi TaxID=77007 RepID=A0ABZ0S2X0_9GAMM|nr:hypothetical protein [Thiorhodovibrio winogradskyi]